MVESLARRTFVVVCVCVCWWTDLLFRQTILGLFVQCAGVVSTPYVFSLSIDIFAFWTDGCIPVFPSGVMENIGDGKHR